MFHPAALRITAIGLIVGATATASIAQVPGQPGAPAGQEQGALAGAREQAQRSAAGLRSFVTPETFERLGFESIDEVNRVQLGVPIPIFMVPLDRLREYRPGQDPADFFVSTNEVRFPLSVDGQVRSSITLRRTNGGWEVARIGRPQLSKEISQVIQASAPGAPLAPRPGTFFEVTIPALSLEFVGQRADNRILLTSLVNEQLYDLQTGQTLDAREVFERLVPFARQLRTGPFIVD
jgi:hypothetical protein